MKLMNVYPLYEQTGASLQTPNGTWEGITLGYGRGAMFAKKKKLGRHKYPGTIK